jgi:hypothetical protein
MFGDTKRKQQVVDFGSCRFAGSDDVEIVGTDTGAVPGLRQKSASDGFDLDPAFHRIGQTAGNQ